MLEHLKWPVTLLEHILIGGLGVAFISLFTVGLLVRLLNLSEITCSVCCAALLVLWNYLVLG